MRDLEVARHTLRNVKEDESKHPNDGIIPEVVNQGDKGEQLALEWLDEDSKSESFTLVESKMSG
jgi:hypothetical protein